MDENLVRREVKMPIYVSAQSLADIKASYDRPENGTKDLRSYFLGKRHQCVIDTLASANGKSKAEVVRDIIDDWVMMKLGERA